MVTPTRKYEDPPPTWSDEGVELEMIPGHAVELTDGPVVYVDARCAPCERTTVANLSAEHREDLQDGRSFANYCPACHVYTPHNVLRILTGLNKNLDRGYLNR